MCCYLHCFAKASHHYPSTLHSRLLTMYLPICKVTIALVYRSVWDDIARFVCKFMSMTKLNVPSVDVTLVDEDQLLAFLYVIPKYCDKIIPVRTRLFMVEPKSMPCKEEFILDIILLK